MNVSISFNQNVRCHPKLIRTNNTGEIQKLPKYLQAVMLQNLWNTFVNHKFKFKQFII